MGGMSIVFSSSRGLTVLVGDRSLNGSSSDCFSSIPFSEIVTGAFDLNTVPINVGVAVDFGVSIVGTGGTGCEGGRGGGGRWVGEKIYRSGSCNRLTARTEL